MSTLEERLKFIERAFSKLQKLIAKDEDGESEQKLRDDFILLLKRVCAVVCRTVCDTESDKEDVIRRAEILINDMVDYAYGKSRLYNFIPSFGHDNEKDRPLLRSKKEGEFSAGLLAAMEPLLRMLPENSLAEPGRKMPTRPEKWSSKYIPSSYSTRCSRFRTEDSGPIFTPNDTNTFARNVFEARCEITSERTNNPSELSMSPDSQFMIMIAGGGWKDRTPFLHYYFPQTLKSAEEEGDFLSEKTMVLALEEIPHTTTIDSQRKLVFVGTDDRIKSYSWNFQNDESGNRNKPLFPTHTFNSRRFNGAMTVLPGGRFVRAGKGSAGVWNLDTQPTHGSSGTDLIGEEIDPEGVDACRDEPEDIELSTGSRPNGTIKFEDQDFKPSIWHSHPDLSKPAVMLSATDPRRHGENGYFCRVLDLGNGGRVASRYLGHGGTVEAFSTSVGDSNVFLTSGSDGFARLFDVRNPLPVLTLDAGCTQQACPDGILIHPDGHPFAFTGTQTSEQIQLWDLRARGCVYELSTGNNAVVSMAWDPVNNALFAATNCDYVDRLGYHHGYRRAKIPKDLKDENDDQENNGMEWNDEDNSDSDDDDDDDFYQYWPKSAYQHEDYFGHNFDAGRHRLYRYAFKSEPNTKIVPYYGDARPSNSSY